MRYDPKKALKALVSAPSTDPVVIGQLGQSLDGRIATPTGKSKYISGQQALAHLHRIRAAVDAVVVGVNTVVVDDPQLTVRMVEGRSPVRVVIDPGARLPHARRCLSDPENGRLLVIRDTDHVETNGLTGRVDVVPIARDANGNLPPEEIIAALHARGLSRILIEGGADTLARCLSAGVVDLLHVMVAPVILGSGQPGFELPAIDELREGLHPRTEVFTFDDGDVLFACDLRRDRAGDVAGDQIADRAERDNDAGLVP
ncbi:MAG: RibD family protein [Pseudomonadota bacterium]